MFTTAIWRTFVTATVRLGCLTLACATLVPSPALAEIPAGLMGKLQSRKDDSRAEAMDELARIGTAEAASLVVKRGLTDTDAYVREKAFAALGNFRSAQAVATLAQEGVLQAPPEVAAQVLEAFADFDDEVSLQCLVGLLGHRDAGLRRASAQSLETRAESTAADTLAKVYKRERDELVRADLLWALVACSPADGRAALLSEALGESAWPVRVAALDLLARHDPAAALVRALAVLDLRLADKRGREPWQEGVAALQAFQGLAEPGSHAEALRNAVDKLIQLLGQETGRLRHEVHLTLASLTGETRRSPDPKLWEAWWRQQRADFDFAAAALRQPEETGTTVTFYGMPIFSDRLQFSLDMSGSMTDPATAEGEHVAGLTWLDVARRELGATLQTLADGVKFNIVLYGTRLMPFQERPVDMNRRSRKAAMDWVTENVTQPKVGRGDLWGALDQAMRDPEVDTVLLFNDGGASEGKYIFKNRILRHLQVENRYGRVAIDSLHFGDAGSGSGGERNLWFSQELARVTGGRFLKK